MNPPTQQCTISAQDDDALTSAAPEDVTQSHPVSAAVVLLPLGPKYEPRFPWDTRLLADEGIRRKARLQVRTRLAVANWMGNIDAAQVAAELVPTAAQHGKPFADEHVILRLLLPSETGELLIEADDASADFSDFGAAASSLRGPESSLGFVRRQEVRLSWDPKKDADGHVLGMTVRALVPASEEELA